MNEEEVLALQEEGAYLEFFIDKSITIDDKLLIDGESFTSLAFSQRAVKEVKQNRRTIYERDAKIH